MNFEHQQSFNTESEKGNYLWINKIIKTQSKFVQEAYTDALTAGIRASYLPRKEKIPEREYIEEIKQCFIDEFKKQIEEYKRIGVIPNSFESGFINICINVWASRMNQREMVNARRELDLSTKTEKDYDSLEWIPDPDFVLHLSKYLFDSDAHTQRAFFLGNERARMFNWREIEIIKNEMIRLEEERIKKEA